MALKVTTAQPKGSLSGSIYWIGQDGNVYLKGAGGNNAPVRNLGNPQQARIWDLGLNGAIQIDDPNPGGGGGGGGSITPAPAAGGGGGGVTRPDRSNSIRMQEAGLAALGEQERQGLSAVDKALENILASYLREAQRNEAQYGTQSTTNKQNLQTNKQVAYTSAAQGRRGLFGTLSSIGALSGSGIELANRAVQQGANADLAGAQGTFNENQTSLDTNIQMFRDADEERKIKARDAAEEARTGVRNSVAQQRQKFLAQLADDYEQMGDTRRSAEYARQAAELYPTLAQTSIPSTNLAPIAAPFTPTTLANYIAGGGTTVSTTPAGPGGLPGLVAGGTPRRRREE